MLRSGCVQFSEQTCLLDVIGISWRHMGLWQNTSTDERRRAPVAEISGSFHGSTLIEFF